MCYNVSFSEAKKVLDAIQRVKNEKAVAKVVLGATEVGTDVECAVKVLGGSEEVAVKFLAKKPSTYAGPVQGAFDNTSLIAVLSSLSLLKEAISIDIVDGIGRFGVAGKAATSLPCLGAEEIPSGVVLDPSSQIVRFFVKQADFISLLRGGGFATAREDNGGRGVNNATLVVEDNRLVLYSCNETGSTIGLASCPIELEDIPSGESTKRADFCKEKGIENLIVPIPQKVVINLLGLLDGENKCSVIVTDKVIMMAPTREVQYLAVVGAKAFTAGVQILGQIEQMPTKGICIVDNEKLSTNLAMIKNFSALASKGGAPVELKIGKDKLMLSQTNGDGKVVIDVVASSFENAEERRLDGEKLSTIIGVLAKGNVRIELRDGENIPLVFTNGSLAEVSGNVKALLAPVQKPVEKEAETTAVEEKAE